MEIELVTEENFNGILYTRGSYHKQTKPCFVKQNLKKGSKTIAMKFNFDQCQTLNDNDQVYTNVVIVQHDEELVTPGDTAFTVECDFRKPRSITIGAELKATTKDR